MQYVAVAKDTVHNLVELVHTDSLYGRKDVFEYKLNNSLLHKPSILYNSMYLP